MPRKNPGLKLPNIPLQKPPISPFQGLQWFPIIKSILEAIKATPDGVLKEGLIGLVAGAAFGATTVAIGQPFDTIKTKMQVQKGFEANTMMQTMRSTINNLGVKGLYRGSLYPFLGSILYRSAQFGAYEAIYTDLNMRFGENKYGLHAFLGGLGSATTRALIETPLEYAKIRKQTQRNWQFTHKHLYRGLGITWIRSTVFLSTFFYTREIAKTKMSHAHPILDPFVMGSVVATAAWGIVWPLEVVKSQVQGSYAAIGEKVSAVECFKRTLTEEGVRGLYRGILPGLLRSVGANGIGLIIYEYVQRSMRS